MDHVTLIMARIHSTKIKNKVSVRRCFHCLFADCKEKCNQCTDFSITIRQFHFWGQFSRPSWQSSRQTTKMRQIIFSTKFFFQMCRKHHLTSSISRSSIPLFLEHSAQVQPWANQDSGNRIQVTQFGFPKALQQVNHYSVGQRIFLMQESARNVSHSKTIWQITISLTSITLKYSSNQTKKKQGKIWLTSNLRWMQFITAKL